jgi:hypothetical protein
MPLEVMTTLRAREALAWRFPKGTVGFAFHRQATGTIRPGSGRMHVRGTNRLGAFFGCTVVYTLSG